MQIELTTTIPVSDKTLTQGSTFETIDCPKEYIHLLNEDGVWIKGSTEPVRVLSREYKVIEGEPENAGANMTENIRALALQQDTLSIAALFYNEGLEADLVTEIALGNKRLSSEGSDVLILDEQDETYRLFLKDYLSRYFKIDNNIYASKTMVLDYGNKDVSFHLDLSLDNNKLAKRASFYLSDSDETLALCKFEGKELNFIFKKIDINLTHFLPLISTDYQSVVDYDTKDHKTIPITGFSELYGKSFTNEADYMNAVDIRSPFFSPQAVFQEDIIEYNQGSEFLGFEDVVFRGETYSVPVAPFILWCGPHTKALHEITRTLSQAYTCKAIRGLKQSFDSIAHSEWVIGAGFDVEEFYRLENNNIDGFAQMINELEERIIAKYSRKDGHSLNETIEPAKTSSEDSYRIKVFNRAENALDNHFLTPSYDNVIPGDCVIITDGGPKDISNILKATESDSAVILTNSSTEVTHIASNAVELNFTFVQVIGFDLSDLCPGDVVVLDLGNNTCQILKNQEIPLAMLPFDRSKAGMLSFLLSEGINVIDGVYYNHLPETISDTPGLPVIVRSSGSNEGGTMKASGIFKSVVCLNGTGIQDAATEVWESFSSHIALAYMKRLNESTKPGILIQPFLKADRSYVIKSTADKLNVSFFNGDCSNIVNGTAGVESFETTLQPSVNEHASAINIFRDIHKLINSDIECELIVKDNVVYVLQCMVI